jgi:uncharacterized BrkB/YihY/UPF0761 family membrane protein
MADQSLREPAFEPQPTAAPRSGLIRILTDVWADIDRDRLDHGPGVAFYTMLSIFPGMSALVSI